jgi:chemotaxis protein MotA
LIGVVGSLGLIIWAILMGGPLNQFIDMPSVVIVFGGTTMALLANFPLPKVVSMVAILKKTLIGSDVDPRGFIEKIVGYADKARKEGMLSLEEYAENEENDFLRKGLRLAVDGNDPALIQKILETDMEQQQTRHLQGKKILEAGGTYAPAFGMIGTLVGLINMLANLDDPSSIGGGMAVALLTTMYGAILANAFFLPLAGKLETRSREEVLVRSMIIEGVMAIQSGDSPRIVEEKLKSFLMPSVQRKMDQDNDLAA